MHKGSVEMKFRTYAIFVWNINEWWHPLCNLACQKCLQYWSLNGLFDLMFTWRQKQNVSSCPRQKEKKQLSSLLSFIAFSKMLHVLTPCVTGEYGGRDYENYHSMECDVMWPLRNLLAFGGMYWIHIQVRKVYSEDECCTIACKFLPSFMASYAITQQPSEYQTG